MTVVMLKHDECHSSAAANRSIFKNMNIDAPPNIFTQQANYFRALAHPVRLQILAILRQGEACVCHLEAILRRRQAYISQQVRVLKEAGLLVERKEGLFVFYRLADPVLISLLDQTIAFTQTQTRMDTSMLLFSGLEAKQCLCPICKPTSS